MINIRKFLKNKKISRARFNSKKSKRVKNKVFKGSPMARGIVLDNKIIKGARQPNSANRKCLRVQLVKNKRRVLAFAPGDKAITFINNHSEVLLSYINRGKSYGDLVGVLYKVEAVDNQPLNRLVRGKIIKR